MNTPLPATHTECLLNFLHQEGLRAVLDEDGDVRFKYEGWVYWVMAPDTDPTYLKVAHPNFWPIEDELERLRALEVAARVQGRFKVGRLTLKGDTVWAMVDAYLPNEQAYQQVLMRNLSALQALISEFCDEMRAAAKN